VDLLGHCDIALRSGAHDPDEVYGDGLLDLLLPNMLHCHDWAYAHMWQLDNVPRCQLRAAQLIRSHVVADWVIHYGDQQTHAKRKCGWAYKKMAVAKAECARFFGVAAERRLLLPDALLPREWTKRHHLDFNHSIIEYSLDVLLARSLPHRYFRMIQDTLLKLAGADAQRWQAGVFSRFDALGATSEHSVSFLKNSIRALAADAAAADSADYFALATVIRKYGFINNATSRDYVRGFLNMIAAQLDCQEVEATLAEIGRIAADPLLIYTVSYGDAPYYFCGPRAHDERL